MVIDGIEIEVQKKNIKNMHLYVKPPDARVLITCPKRIGKRDIERFAREHIGWIKRKQGEVLARQKNAPEKCEYKTGDSFYLWGKEYLVIAKSSSRFSVNIIGNNAYISYPENMPFEKLEAHIKEFYRAELKKKIDVLLPFWEEKTGLSCSSYQTRDMKTRWGTCNTKTKKLWFSLRLAKNSEEYLNYIILHELAHTKIPNHSAEFKALLKQYMPSFRETEIKMKKAL